MQSVLSQILDGSLLSVEFSDGIYKYTGMYSSFSVGKIEPSLVITYLRFVGALKGRVEECNPSFPALEEESSAKNRSEQTLSDFHLQ